MPFDFIFGEVEQRAGMVGEVLDEPAVEVGEPKE